MMPQASTHPLKTSRPSTKVATQWIDQIKHQLQHQHMVLVHLKIHGPMQYRVWPTTYLFDQNSTHRSQLLHLENVSMYPDWAWVPDEKCRSGLLVFEGLPKSCLAFDFREIIPEPGAFEQVGILRDPSDIYTIEIK